MDSRQEAALRRIYEADRALVRAGKEPKRFFLRFPSGSGGRIEHDGWDPSWAIPSGETIDDLGELDLLRVVPPHNKARVFSLAVEGREKAEELFDPKVNPTELAPQNDSRDPRDVALMHGRDEKATLWMTRWLRAIDLVPLEWGDLVKATGKGSPYNGEAVEAAFKQAQAVVILFTPDESGFLHPELGPADDDGPQPRLNVVLEAGMALQSHPERTILVEIGSTRTISDLAGRNAVRLTGGHKGLIELANRLDTAGCPVKRTRPDWLDTAGLTELTALKRREVRPTPVGGVAGTGSDGSVHHLFRIHGRHVEQRTHDGAGWSGWKEIGGLPNEAVGLAAASIDADRVEVFALLADGQVVHNWWRREEGWHGEFANLGQPFPEQRAVRIAATSKGDGHQEVFVETDHGEVGRIWWMGKWRHNNNDATRLNSGWWRW